MITNLKKTGECDSIEEVRQQIDRIDAELVRLFAERTNYVKEITRFKSNKPEEIIAEERKQLVIKQRSEWAEKLGLDKRVYAHLFKTLIEHNISIEFDLLKKEHEIIH
jgi:isochorismate pyruvate lyase